MGNPVAACASQFQTQGMRYEATSNRLWCALCTTGKGAASRCPDATAVPSLEELLCVVGSTAEDVLAHCATREHLLRFERIRLSGLQHWCPVELHGERVLLSHHCIYPSRVFGPGRILLDETIAGGVLLGHDVCGGVRLWPHHRYTVVEMLLPQADAFVDHTTVGGGTDGTDGTDGGADGADESNAGRGAPSLQVFYERASALPEASATSRSPNEGNVRTVGVQRLPSFHEQRGIRGVQVRRSDLAQVLKDANGYVRSEAEYHQRKATALSKINLQ